MITRPALRYHGGKWRLAPWIISHMPECGIYCEPYAGAASVLLRRRRVKIEVLNDLSGDIVCLFKVLRSTSGHHDLLQQCLRTPYAREEWEAAWETSDDEIERSRRLLIRSWMSHGSSATTGRRCQAGFRRSPNGHGSGSHPAMNWAEWPQQIEALHERLRGVLIESRPALDVIAAYDHPNALHYIDPPYVTATRSRSDHGYQFEMNEGQHRDLATVLHSLKGSVVLSGYPCELYRQIYPTWRRIDRHSRKDGGAAAVESLWLNEAAEIARKVAV